jgi:exonuclease III
MQRVRKLAKPNRLCVVDTMIRRHVNILCVQEIKWTEQKTKEVKDTDFNLWYTCTTTIKNEVGIVIDKSLKDGVVDIKW